MKDDVRAPSAAELWERFSSLSADAKQLLRLKSMVFRDRLHPCVLPARLHAVSAKNLGIRLFVTDRCP